MSQRTRIRRRSAQLCALALMASMGCAFGEIRPDDPFKRQYSLEESQKRYTDLIRWSKFNEASAFVDPEMQQEFMGRAPDFEDVRFTDYESGAIELDDAKRAAVITVNYRAYHMSALIEMDVEETQEWYREEDGWNQWRVRPSFDDLDRLLGSN